MGDAPETSLHEPSVHLPSDLPTKPFSFGPPPVSVAAGKAEGRPEQAEVKPVVRSFVRFVHQLSTTAYFTVQHRSKTPLPLHSQSLILASAAHRTPITSSPPLSLQITDHRPSHAFETGAVVISQVRYCPVATCLVEHQPLHPEERRRRLWTGTLARALPLSCARYGPELLGGRAAHFIRPLRTTPVPTGGGPILWNRPRA